MIDKWDCKSNDMNVLLGFSNRRKCKIIIIIIIIIIIVKIWSSRRAPVFGLDIARIHLGG